MYIEENNIKVFDSNYNLNISCSESLSENKFSDNICTYKENLNDLKCEFKNNFNLKKFKINNNNNNNNFNYNNIKFNTDFNNNNNTDINTDYQSKN